MNFFDSLYKATLFDNRWTWYFQGLGKTLLISLGAVTLGIFIGIIVSLVKYVHKKFGAFKVLNKIFDIYLAVFRGTPVYVQLLIMYLIVLVKATDVWIAIITFGVNSGAYVAEIIRGGLESIDDGQIEAGCSLGLNKLQVMLFIILPQAVRRALPPLCNEFISLIKETSIVGTIGVVDLTKVAARIVARTYEPFAPYLIIAAMYLIIVVVLSKLLKLLERRLAKSDRQ